MPLLRLPKPLCFSTARLRIKIIPQWPCFTTIRTCSCHAPLAFSATVSLQSTRTENGINRISRNERQNEDWIKAATKPIDHRDIGTQQSLWTLHPSSPGSPFFLPDGAHIFQKLIDFLRAQYPTYGFQEVLTPTLFKETLWKQSGHWDNYKDDMFTVNGKSSNSSPQFAPPESKDGSLQARQRTFDVEEVEKLGLKPMNCPAHCVLFASQRRSYRDLPIRYADFSPLHRDEISGALSGLTRVRRFHQDDGHIFCRPTQVMSEVAKSLEFVDTVYRVMGLKVYKFVLSTRPERDYIGTVEEWDQAEGQLKKALQASAVGWEMNRGDGAFYGPKIDVIVQGSDGRLHQTATTQLDFQLPKRFKLSYEGPSEDLTAAGETTLDVGKDKGLTPVMIHRAIFGSLERFMALLIENNRGKWPFWLSPRQVLILTVTNIPTVLEYTEKIAARLRNPDGDSSPRKMNQRSYIVDVDSSSDTLNRKIAKAKGKWYNVIVIIGEKNVKGQFLSVEVSGQPDQRKTWDSIEKVKPGSEAPVQKDRGTGAKLKGLNGVELSPGELVRAMRLWTDDYI